MKVEFSPSQIIVGRKLVHWLRCQGMPVQMARMEVKGVLLGYPVEIIERAMRQVNCTNLKNLKTLLSTYAQRRHANAK